MNKTTDAMNPGDKTLETGTSLVESAMVPPSCLVESGNDNPNYMSLPYSRMHEDHLVNDFQQDIGLSSETNLAQTDEDDFIAQRYVADLSIISNSETLRTAAVSSSLNPLASTFVPFNNSRPIVTNSFGLSTDNMDCSMDSASSSIFSPTYSSSINPYNPSTDYFGSLRSTSSISFFANSEGRIKDSDELKTEIETNENTLSRGKQTKGKEEPRIHVVSNAESPNKVSFKDNRKCKEEFKKAYKTDASKRFNGILPNSILLDFSRLKPKPGFIDTHCHLDYLFERQNYNGTHAEYMRKNRDSYPVNYEGCVAVFCDPFTFLQEGMWRKYLDEESVWGAFGCHPHHAKYYDDSKEAALCDVLLHSKVRALGEIGLDYSKRNDCPKETQHDVLRRQLRIATMLRLPVVIHCRDANEDCMQIVKEILPRDHAIHLHCFTDSWSRAQQWLSEFPNLFVGITNLVTYPTARDTHEVAKKISLKRLLLETDAPYFAPRTGMKSSRCSKWSHPGMAIHVAQQIATLREMPIEEVLYWARQNTHKMYGI